MAIPDDDDWKGARRDELIVYELHVGAFTQAGTYAAAIDRLDELVDLGVTAIELMPLADAAGRWNWGYDGVNLYAPNRNYGSPQDLSRFIDAAHSRGLAVFLDVVYNPRRTKLLKDAEAGGCRTIEGIEMFLGQAYVQFELWTGQKAPRDVMRQVVEQRL